MRTTPANDLRVERTMEAIDGAFRAMMLEGGYASVSVKGLCARARINKKTFYRYYESLDDLLLETMSSYAAAWRRRTARLRLPEDLAESTREFFRFGAEQDELYEAITCDPAFGAIQREMQDMASGEHIDEIPQGWDAAAWHVTLAGTSAATLAMYRAWVADGKRIPLDDICELAVSLLCAGIGGLPCRSPAHRQ